MEMTVKTKVVSEELGVNPTTIQRWVKYFNIPCERNEHGHYLFRDKDIMQLKYIKRQLNLGLPMSQIELGQASQKRETNNVSPEQQVTVAELVQKFDSMFSRLEDVEVQLEKKAADVVSVQILQHRREIDSLHKKIEKLEKEMEQLKAAKKEAEIIPFKPKDKNVPKRRWLASLLSIF